MAKLLMFGAGDIARLAHYYFTHDSRHEVAGFTVDPQYLNSSEFLGLPLVSWEEVERIYPPADFKMFVALSYSGMNQVRAARYAEAKARGYRLASYVSSRCTYLTQHAVGDNCFVLEDNTIQPFVRIGNNVTLWSGNHIGHDSTIEDHCFLASHIVVSGNCRIGAYTFIGVNATLRNSITVAPRTLIGAGALIMEDTVERGVYIAERTRAHRKSSDEVTL